MADNYIGFPITVQGCLDYCLHNVKPIKGCDDKFRQEMCKDFCTEERLTRVNNNLRRIITLSDGSNYVSADGMGLRRFEQHFKWNMSDDFRRLCEAMESNRRAIREMDARRRSLSVSTPKPSNQSQFHAPKDNSPSTLGLVVVLGLTAITLVATRGRAATAVIGALSLYRTDPEGFRKLASDEMEADPCFPYNHSDRFNKYVSDE